jgi:urea transport system substrate-binding protein
VSLGSRIALTVAGAVAALALALAAIRGEGGRASREPIRVGVLHSLTGPMATSEVPVVNAIRMAADEVNAQGGVLGRPIELVVRDGKSDPAVFAAEAERLLDDDRVSVIFGCWTSASRRTVRPVVERLQGLMVYPVQYEGVESSPNLVYAGAAPNQQIVPAVQWLFSRGARRLALVGSDYVFPHVANAIIRDLARSLGGEVVIERYVPLDGGGEDEAARAIAAARPDVILNTVNGDANRALMRALRASGIEPGRTPVMSFSIAEPQIAAWSPDAFVGDFVAATYFESMPHAESRSFARALRAHHGDSARGSDAIESAYTAFMLWVQGVRDAGTAEPKAVRSAMSGMFTVGPAGIAIVDASTGHLWRTARIGEVMADGSIRVAWESGSPIRPMPYPLWRSRRDWDRFLGDMRSAWRGSWSSPGDVDAPRPHWERASPKAAGGEP